MCITRHNGWIYTKKRLNWHLNELRLWLDMAAIILRCYHHTDCCTDWYIISEPKQWNYLTILNWLVNHVPSSCWLVNWNDSAEVTASRKGPKDGQKHHHLSRVAFPKIYQIHIQICRLFACLLVLVHSMFTLTDYNKPRAPQKKSSYDLHRPGATLSSNQLLTHIMQHSGTSS